MMSLSMRPSPSPYPLTEESPSVIAYQYVIVIGAFAVFAVLAPLHALMPPSYRIVWHVVALLAALAGAIGAIIGATMASSLAPSNGTIWQTTPTAVVLLCLAFLIQIKIIGGWHVLRLRALFPGRIRLTVLQDSHWRDDVSVEEYTRLALQSQVSGKMLAFGSEPDQDAAVVALLPALRRWAMDRGQRSSARTPTPPRGHQPHQRAYMRHEPGGLVFLGSVRHNHLWLAPLLEAHRSQPRLHLAHIHHFFVVLWWLGMIFGGLSKSGFNHYKVKHASGQGVENLATAGIWVEALLLIIAVYAFPYTRSMARYGMRVYPRMILLILQSLSSFGLGLALLILVRQNKVNQNLVAYATALMICATAACVWNLIAVHCYQSARQTLLTLGETIIRANEAAYFAAVVSRPRYGYRGDAPILRFGELDDAGYAALEVAIVEDQSIRQTTETIDERMLELEYANEWQLLENASKGHG